MEDWRWMELVHFRAQWQPLVQAVSFNWLGSTTEAKTHCIAKANQNSEHLITHDLQKRNFNNKLDNFKFCWPCISIYFLVGDQLDAQLFCIIRLFQSSTCFEQTHVHHQEVNCINTASGIFNLCRWPGGHLQRVAIPDAVLIQSTSWWWARVCSKHIEDWKKKYYIKELCVKLVTYQKKS